MAQSNVVVPDAVKTNATACGFLLLTTYALAMAPAVAGKNGPAKNISCGSGKKENWKKKKQKNEAAANADDSDIARAAPVTKKLPGGSFIRQDRLLLHWFQYL